MEHFLAILSDHFKKYSEYRVNPNDEILTKETIKLFHVLNSIDEKSDIVLVAKKT